MLFICTDSNEAKRCVHLLHASIPIYLLSWCYDDFLLSDDIWNCLYEFTHVKQVHIAQLL